MPITYLKRAEIDSLKWDKCVNFHLINSAVFAQHWFLDGCCERWDAVVVGDYQAVLPLPIRRKWGVDYVYPPFFAFRLGFFGKELTQKEMDEALDLVAKKFKWADMFFSADIQYKKGNIIPHRTYLLDLQADYETVRKNYHESHRRNCKKGKEENHRIVFDADPQEIINLFRNNRGKEASVGYKASDYEALLHIVSLLRTQKAVEIAGVRNEDGVLCAGAFFPFWDGKYSFLFSGRNSDKQSRSLYFLIDDFIVRHAGEARFLDFNGSDNPAIARFYAGFGAKEMLFTQLTINQLGLLQRGALLFKRMLNFRLSQLKSKTHLKCAYSKSDGRKKKMLRVLLILSFIFKGTSKNSFFQFNFSK